jgi:hypothetical protein
MKGEIIRSTKCTVSNIDWDKVQLLRYGTNLVLSTGEHGEDNFQGINLISAVFSNAFIKSYYQPVPPTEIVTINFQND